MLAATLAGLEATLHPKPRAPITVSLSDHRPAADGARRSVLCHRPGSLPASLPDGAGIPGFRAQRHLKTR
jgi:hypothetical protein